MKSKVVLTGLLLALVFTSFSFKCDGGNGPGVSDPYRKAAKAADDMAAALNTMAKIKRELGTSGKLSRDRELALTNLLLKANTADKEFVKQIKALKADPNPASKATLCSLFTTVTSALADLNDNGILPIDNPESKSKLAAVFNTITAASGIIASVGLCS